jgi:hypothetical protein
LFDVTFHVGAVMREYSGAFICLHGLRRISETSEMANTLASKAP